MVFHFHRFTFVFFPLFPLALTNPDFIAPQKIPLILFYLSPCITRTLLQVEGQNPAAQQDGRAAVGVRAVGRARLGEWLEKSVGNQDPRLPPKALCARHGAVRYAVQR